MKKFLAIVIALVMLCSSAIAEQNIGISTVEFLAMYEGFLEPFGLPYWSIDLEESEKEESYIIKLITDNISLAFYQSEGMVTQFKIVTNLKDRSNEDQVNNLMFCIMGALMVTDLNMSAKEAMDYAAQIIKGQDLTMNGLNYHFFTSPFITQVAFEVTVAGGQP